MPKLLNVHEVAKVLGCRWQTVMRRAERGEFAVGLIIGGTDRVWTPSMVEDFILGRIARVGKGVDA